MKKRKEKFFGVSLRTRIMILVGIMILTSFISIFVISGQIIHRVTQSKIENAYVSSLSTLLTTVENVIDNLELLSQQVGFGMNIAEDITELHSPLTDSYRKVQLNQQIMDRLRQLTFANVNIGLVFFEYEDEITISSFNVNKKMTEEDENYLCRANELWFFGPKKSLAGYNSGEVICLMREIKKVTEDSGNIYLGIETNYNTLERLLKTDKDSVKGLVFVNDQGDICYTTIPELCPRGKAFEKCVSSNDMIGDYRYFIKQSEMGFSIAEIVDLRLEKGKNFSEYYSVFGMMVLFVAVLIFLFILVWRNIYAPLKQFDGELGKLLTKEGADTQKIALTGMTEYDHLLNKIEEMRRQIQDMLQEIVSKEEEKSKMEIEKLRYQINPHFLMNTLNTIHWMAVMDNQPEIDKVIQALNRLLFYNLDKDGYHTDIERELSAMGEYMLLQKIRLYDFTYEIRREPENATFNYAIPKFILQPVIENCFTHGYRDNMHIELIVRNHKEFVEILIQDDGLGIEKRQIERINDYADDKSRVVKDQNVHHIGIGLEYVIQSLERFYNKDDKKGSFVIEKRKDRGTRVKITVPKKCVENRNVESVDR